MNRFQVGDVEDANERAALKTKLRRLSKKVARLNTWNAIKHGPHYVMQLVSFEQHRRLSRTKKLRTVLYGLSIHGEVLQIGPLPFEGMVDYLNKEFGFKQKLKS